MNKLIRIFKHIFIPHEHNDYKPHFFRELSVLTITAVLVALLSLSAGTIIYINNNNLRATVLSAVLVDLTNNARLSNNAGMLARNTTLDSAAQLKAADMAKYGYFAHVSPAGITPWHWFSKAGYTFVYAGENLAINFTESVAVENSWLNSPTHRANILNNNFTEIGIATIDGTYQGSPTTYVVQMFGKPAFARTNETKTTTPVKTVAPEPKLVKAETPKPTTLAVAPVVKGETVVVKNPDLETITDTKEFVAVKDITAEEVSSTPTERVRYSTWKDRFVFLAPEYTDRIYRVFILIVLIALLIMTVVEIRRQHARNIIYGVLLLVIMLCLIYINKTMFMTSFIS